MTADDRLFDVTTIPSRQVETPTLAVQGVRWCAGSGVPGDNCERGHPIAAEWADDAWRLSEPGRDTSRPTCHRCEITRRNWRDSLDDGDHAKAKAWLQKHARTLGQAWNLTTAETRLRFDLNGVTEDFMFHLFQDARSRGTCPDWRHGGCGECFAPGAHDITGDIKDPASVEARGYLLCEDVHAQCFTCNRSKGRRTWWEWLRLCAFFASCKRYAPVGWQGHIEIP